MSLTLPVSCDDDLLAQPPCYQAPPSLGFQGCGALPWRQRPAACSCCRKTDNVGTARTCCKLVLAAGRGYRSDHRLTGACHMV